jgi:hypothetical protein
MYFVGARNQVGCFVEALIHFEGARNLVDLIVGAFMHFMKCWKSSWLLHWIHFVIVGNYVG